MERFTKFTGKRTDNGEWIIGSLFIANKLITETWICPDTTYADFYPNLADGEVKFNELKYEGSALGHFFEVIPESVGQFTGLKDKNEIDVYKGWLIEVPESETMKGGIHQVHYYKDAFVTSSVLFNCLETANKHTLSFIIGQGGVVIGNTTDNQELLIK